MIITEDGPLNGRIGTITGVSETSEHILYVQLREGGPHIPVGEQEMRAASQQCKDCLGRGWIAGPIYAMEGSHKCPTCNGTGTIYRTGPYRLTDGIWSDGVDRSSKIRLHKFHLDNPSRPIVLQTWDQRPDGGYDWVAIESKYGEPEYFPTFEEAIAYADKAARGGE